MEVQISEKIRTRPSTSEESIYLNFHKRFEEYLDRNQEAEEIRIWVPECEDGKHVLLITMISYQILQSRKRDIPLYVIGSTLDPATILKAKKTVFSQSDIHDFPCRLLKYLVSDNGIFFHVDPAITSKILFVDHDILKDPPFVHLDAIVFPNFKKVIKAPYQEKVLLYLHFALKDHAFLQFENKGGFADKNMEQAFLVHGDGRTLTKIKNSKPTSFIDFFRLSFAKPKLAVKAAPEFRNKSPTSPLSKQVAEGLSEIYAQCTVVIDTDFKVVYSLGKFCDIFKIQSGAVQRTLLDQVVPALKPLLTEILIQAAKYPEQTQDIMTTVSEVVYRVVCKKMPHTNNLFLISFSKQNPNLLSASDQKNIDQIEGLKSQLAESHRNHKAFAAKILESRTEFEKLNEELYESNSELTSKNEELKALNQALEVLNKKLELISMEKQIKSELLLKSNDFLEQLLNALKSPIVVLDNDFRVIKFNQNAMRIFSINDSRLSQSIFDIPAYFDASLFYRSLKKRRVKSADKEIILACDGQYFRLKIQHTHPNMDEKNKIILEFVDVTSIQKSKNELSFSKLLYQNLTENLPDTACILVNKNNFIEIASGKLLKNLKLKPIENSQITLEKYFEPFIAIDFEKLKTVDHLEISDAQHTFLIFHIDFPLSDDQKTLYVIKEVTGFRSLQNNLEMHIERLKRSNEDLKSFASVASHDLKAPISRIEYFAEELFEELKSTLNEQQTKKFKAILRSSGRLIDLIKSILNYAKVSSVFEGDENIFDLNQLIDEIGSELSVKDDFKLSVKKPLPSVKGPYILVYQLFYNLLSNAVKFHKPDKKPNIKVFSRPSPIAAYHEVCIQDEGIGIPERKVGAIFKLFERGHHSPNFEGAGIGLSIVSKVLEKLDWYIEVVSKEGEGSTFCIGIKNGLESGPKEKDQDHPERQKPQSQRK